MGRPLHLVQRETDYRNTMPTHSCPSLPCYQGPAYTSILNIILLVYSSALMLAFEPGITETTHRYSNAFTRPNTKA